MLPERFIQFASGGDVQHDVPHGAQPLDLRLTQSARGIVDGTSPFEPQHRAAERPYWAQSGMPELARVAIALPIIFAVAGLPLLVHELGHYIAARACGRLVRLVAIGFGPKLIERLIGEAPRGASPSSRSAATSRSTRTPCKPATSYFGPLRSWSGLLSRPLVQLPT